MPELTKREVSYPGFEIKESLGASECKQIDLGKIDPKTDYSINFEYLTTSAGLIKNPTFREKPSVSKRKSKRYLS